MQSYIGGNLSKDMLKKRSYYIRSGKETRYDKLPGFKHTLSL